MLNERGEKGKNQRGSSNPTRANSGGKDQVMKNNNQGNALKERLCPLKLRGKKRKDLGGLHEGIEKPYVRKLESP